MNVCFVSHILEVAEICFGDHSTSIKQGALETPAIEDKINILDESVNAAWIMSSVALTFNDELTMNAWPSKQN